MKTLYTTINYTTLALAHATLNDLDRVSSVFDQTGIDSDVAISAKCHPADFTYHDVSKFINKAVELTTPPKDAENHDLLKAVKQLADEKNMRFTSTDETLTFVVPGNDYLTSQYFTVYVKDDKLMIDHYNEVYGTSTLNDEFDYETGDYTSFTPESFFELIQVTTAQFEIVREALGKVPFINVI